MYNGIGNIVSVTKRTGNSTGSTTTFGYDTAHPDRLTSFGSKAITYNDNGGVASYDGWDYVWSNGKLSSIRKSSGSSSRAINPPVLLPNKTYSFTYNAYGQRVTSSYSHFWLDGALVSVQSGEVINYTKQFSYDHAGRLIAEVVNGEKYEMGSFSKTLRYLYDESAIVGVQYTNGANTNAYYFLKNLQGDVIAIYDTAGAKVVSYSYDAWGNCTIDSSTTNYDLAHDNPIRYRGYYYDEATKLYYLHARYYSPEFRRFISPDDTNYLDPETPNGLNLYCYCNNDPVNYADPSGHDLIISLGILGFFATVAAGIVTATLAIGTVIGLVFEGIGRVVVGIFEGIAKGLAAFFEGFFRLILGKPSTDDVDSVSGLVGQPHHSDHAISNGTQNQHGTPNYYVDWNQRSPGYFGIGGTIAGDPLLYKSSAETHFLPCN